MPRPDRHREPLVAAAARSLQRHGWAATSVGDVLREAGAPNGSLYHHFPAGKADLGRAALEASAQRVDASLARALHRQPEPAAALRAWLGALITELRRDPRDGCPIATAGVELAAGDHELRAVVVAAFDRWSATLAAHLDDVTTARVVLSAVEGALLLDRVSRGTAHLEAVRDRVDALLGSTG